MAPAQLESLIIQLFDIKAVKFGSFTLKSGIQSPIYFDLRVIVSYPDILKAVSDYMWQMIEELGCHYHSVCGVPYTALPIAAVLCADHGKPMLMRRKEAKDYGTKKMLEGVYNDGDVCIILEDVVTSGSSVLETVQVLNQHKIQVKDAIVLLNREQGGQEKLQESGIKLHSVCTMTKLVEVLIKANKIDAGTAQQVEAFIKENNTFQPQTTITKPAKPAALRYEDRAALCSNPNTKKLFNIMTTKQSNLCLSADVTTTKELLQLVDEIGPHVCMVKTHIDILDDFTADVPVQLKKLAEKHNFILFEDRKFADIGNTVKQQYAGGIYKIAEWADIINAHTLPGPGIIDGLKQVGLPKRRACLLLAEMSSKGNLLSSDYTAATVAQAEENRDFVIGFICRKKLSDNPQMIHMTPGVQLLEGEDSLGQQYLTPAKVISETRSDIIIVGRGITQAKQPAQTARDYQKAGYQAYLDLFQ